MKVLGFLLLVSGWVIVLAALILLGQAWQQRVFVLAGAGVEVLGLILAVRAHRLPREEAE